jgi:hypothetical protein
MMFLRRFWLKYFLLFLRSKVVDHTLCLVWSFSWLFNQINVIKIIYFIFQAKILIYLGSSLNSLFLIKNWPCSSLDRLNILFSFQIHPAWINFNLYFSQNNSKNKFLLYLYLIVYELRLNMIKFRWKFSFLFVVFS